MNIRLPEGGVVIGVGTDLIECERIARTLERQGDRFLEKVYTEGERKYCMQMKNPVPYLAARFAAKEAVAKAFTTGIGTELDWKSMEVVKGERDEPILKLDAKGESLLKAVGASAVLISISHTRGHGQAIALLVRAVNYTL